MGPGQHCDGQHGAALEGAAGTRRLAATSIWVRHAVSYCCHLQIYNCEGLMLLVHLSACLSVCLSVRLSVCLSVCLSFCLSVCLSVAYCRCLCVCRSVCLFVYVLACTAAFAEVGRPCTKARLFFFSSRSFVFVTQQSGIGSHRRGL